MTAPDTIPLEPGTTGGGAIHSPAAPFGHGEHNTTGETANSDRPFPAQSLSSFHKRVYA